MINDKYVDLLKDEYKQSYLLYKKGSLKLEAWSSHQPLLIHVLNTIKSGDVLEFGTGYNSTPIMHIICAFQQRKLLSIETNKKWVEKSLKWRNINHVIELVSSKEILKHSLFRHKFSIAFIDGAPAEVRQPFLEKVQADYLIVHDTECIVRGIKNVYGYDFSMFKHVYHFKKDSTMSTLLSNLDKIDKDLLTIF
jgi:hypothetical protein